MIVPGLGERGDQNGAGACRWCGKKLATDPVEGSGYSGLGQFCTKGCGFMFGQKLAQNGARLTKKGLSTYARTRVF